MKPGICTIFCLNLMICWPAWADLGGSSADITQHRMATRHALAVPFTRYSYVTPQGTQMEEYAGSDGTIIAQRWQGSAPPNLEHTLGSYAQTLHQYRPRRPDHHRLYLATPDLVVESRMYLGHFQGYSYLPKALPPGITMQDLN
ncbi:MAG: DUF2844 domain-containing protein [Pseudomonadales bacterium]|nr:DUF2844 domain-containing protein [Pseudomonadales bacterium]